MSNKSKLKYLIMLGFILVVVLINYIELKIFQTGIFLPDDKKLENLIVPTLESELGLFVISFLTGLRLLLISGVSFFLVITFIDWVNDFLSAEMKFRIVWLPMDTSWLVFFLTLLASISATFIFFVTRLPSTLFYGTDHFEKGATLFIAQIFLSIGLAFISSVCVTNVFRYIQYRAILAQDLTAAPNLTADSSEVTLSALEQFRINLTQEVADSIDSVSDPIAQKLREITLLICRDEQGQLEIDWCLKYIQKMNNPSISYPADVFSIDSHTSVRAIYPAALLLWSEQIRANNSIGSFDFLPKCSQDLFESWRKSLESFFLNTLDIAHDNFKSANATMEGNSAPNDINLQVLKNNIKRGENLSCRVIIYDVEILKNEVVRAVIDFHDAVNIPLFFLPATYLREFSFDYSHCSTERETVIQDYQALTHSLYEESHFHWIPKDYSLPNDKKIWGGPDDDFIIIDDTAWRGYPVSTHLKKEIVMQEHNPLSFYSKLLCLLRAPGILMARNARDLALRGSKDQLSSGSESLEKWYQGLFLSTNNKNGSD